MSILKQDNQTPVNQTPVNQTKETQYLLDPNNIDKKQYLIKTILLMFLLVLGFFLIQQNIISHITDNEWLSHYVKNSTYLTKLFFILSCSLLLSAGFPRALLALTFGYLFDLKWAMVLSVLVLGISCFVSFYCARFLIRPLIVKRFNSKVVKIDHWIKNRAWLKILSIRLLPVGNNAVTNFIAGASAISFKDFLLGSLIGYQPQTLIFASAGAGLAIGDEQKFIISLISLIILFVISVYLYKSNALK